MALSLEIKDFILGLEQKKSAQWLIMKDELFEELVNSIREGGQILRGEVSPAREGVSVNQVIALTLAEKMAELKVVGYLERLRQQPEVSTQTFLDILAQAPDVEPENPLDRILKHKNKK